MTRVSPTPSVENESSGVSESIATYEPSTKSESESTTPTSSERNDLQTLVSNPLSSSGLDGPRGPESTSRDLSSQTVHRDARTVPAPGPERSMPRPPGRLGLPQAGHCPRASGASAIAASARSAAARRRLTPTTS